MFIVLVIEAPAADLLSGVPHIVDGDTIAIGDTKICLEGIDAPETDHLCLDEHAAKWTVASPRVIISLSMSQADRSIARPMAQTPTAAPCGL
jgi:hypothetical protein